jgi:hypothetical protein
MKQTRILHIVPTLLLVLIVGTSASTAGDKKISKKQIPGAVMKAFTAQYPQAAIKGQAIEKEKKSTYYEIESVDGKTKRDLLYTPEGKVVEIEETIDPSTLTDAMKSAIGQEYPKGKILTAEKVTRDSVVTFEVQVRVGKKSAELSFDASGTRLKVGDSDEEKEDKDDDDEKED